MPDGQSGKRHEDVQPAGLPVENSGVQLGHRGPRGPQPAQTVHTAPLRALFRSRAAIRLARIGLVLSLALITTASLAPAPDVMSVTHVDKLMHFAAYAGVAGLVVLSRWTGLAGAILLAFTWGMGVEIAQGMAGTGRHPSVADIVANGVGAVVGAVIARWLVRLP